MNTSQQIPYFVNFNFHLDLKFSFNYSVCKQLHYLCLRIIELLLYFDYNLSTDIQL